MSHAVPRFLIDEDLSPALVAVAAKRISSLIGRGDAVIARHAIANDCILVARNVVDFDEIYNSLTLCLTLTRPSSRGLFFSPATHRV